MFSLAVVVVSIVLISLFGIIAIVAMIILIIRMKNLLLNKEIEEDRNEKDRYVGEAIGSCAKYVCWSIFGVSVAICIAFVIILILQYV